MASALFLEEIRKLQPKVPSGQESDQREFTGERFLPGYADGSIDLQHIHRYSFALQFVVGRSVLDIACGEGYGSDLLAQLADKVIGVDIDAATIETAQKRYRRPNLSFKQGSAGAIPLEDQSIDVIVSFETIEHLADHNVFWSQVKRVLRKAGVLVVSSPNRDVYNQHRTGENPFHLRELSKEELVGELSQRFLHHQLFSQAVVFGSLIMPVSAEPIPQSVISLDPGTRVLRWQVGDDVENPYLIAIASDEVTPLVGQSLYTGHYPPDAMASLTGGIVERDLLVRDLRSQIADFEASRSALVAAARQERDEATLTAKRIEDTAKRVEEDLIEEKHLLINEKQVLAQQLDQAQMQGERLRETLAEHDGVIGALRTLVDEYAQRVVTADVVKSQEYVPSSENRS